MTELLPQEANEKSLWVHTAVPAPECAELEDSVQADVLVVGAGFTGLSAALHLAEQGISVVLLEASSIGFGGSGRNAGLVNAGIWQNPQHVASLLGSEPAQRFNLALRDSPAQVFALVERLGLQCEAERSGTIHLAHGKSAMSYLQERCRQLQELGAGVELIDGANAAVLSGSPAYRYGGIVDADAGTIQPLSYARELARAAMASGAALYQRSAITSLQRHQDRWQAITAGGRVVADQVILATNAYSDANAAGVRESILPVYIFQFATAPLPADILAELIPQRHGLWDTHPLLTSSRIDADGRLVMSFPGRLQGGQRGLREAFATRRRNSLFPQLRGIPWEYSWTGRVGVTSSRVLRVQLLAPGLFAPAGYNGRGIGTGTVMGKQLAQTIGSGNRGDFPFPIEVLHREKWRTTRAAYFDYGTLALQFCSHRW